MAKKKTAQKGASCWTDGTHALLRYAVAIMFLSAGIPKLVALFSSQNPLGGFGIPLWLAWVVAIVEGVGGLALLLGVLRTYVAPLLIVVMVIAAIMTYKGPFFWGGLGGIAKHLVFLAGAAVVIFYKDACAIGKC
jgi:putative oxidoreductase